MFSEMIKKKRQMNEQACIGLLEKEDYGVLSLPTNEGYPYTVPMNYVMDSDCLYFHCAKKGYKLELIEQSSKAAFCVVGIHEVIAKDYTTKYQSVNVVGEISQLKDEIKIKAVLKQLVLKYAPDDSEEKIQTTLQKYHDNVTVLEMTIQEMSGKSSIK